MSRSFEPNLFDTVSNQLNSCIRDDIEESYDEYYLLDTLKDFKPCCGQKETRLFKKAINKLLYVKPQIDQLYIYLAVLYYYYYTIVLEYYITDMCPIKTIFKKLNLPTRDIKIVETLIMEITTSDEEWASSVRRTLNNWDKLSSFANGGKKRRTNRRNKTTNGKKNKNVKRKKTKRVRKL